MSIVYEFRVESRVRWRDEGGSWSNEGHNIQNRLGCRPLVYGTVFSGNLTVGARLKKVRQGRLKTVKGEKRRSGAIKDP